MTPQEAKQVLLVYRPGTADANEPQIIEALALAGSDPELGRWWEAHRAFQQAMQAKFRQIEVPAHLKSSLVIRGNTQTKPLPPQVWWRSPAWLTTATAALLVLAWVGLRFQPKSADGLANFQTRMVGAALREYRMDLVTNDMRQVREFLAKRGAPADYQTTAGLDQLQLTGAGLMRWRSNPVAMVCFNRGDNQMLFLFVMNRSALTDPPAETPQLTKVRNLMTASWTRGNKTYLLAGPEEPDFARKYLPPNS